MRRIVARFMLLRFAGMFLFVVFTLTSLLALFDLLAHAEVLSLHHAETLLPMSYYTGLRLPVLLAMITPMSALLAALITFERLATQFELVALQSAGMSIYQACLVMLSGGLMVAGLQFAVVSELATGAEARIFRWAERDYAGLPDRSVLEPGPTWFATDRFQLHVANARDRGRQLDSVQLIELDSPGSILTYHMAREARANDSGWTLIDGWKQTVATGRREQFETLEVPLALDPREVERARLPVSSLTLGELRTLGADSGERAGERAHIYRTWAARRIAEPLGTLVMILLAAPLGLQLRRSGRQLRWGALAVGLGFLFFIFERILLALGESGAVAPAVAAWSPLGAFTAIGIVLLYRVKK